MDWSKFNFGPASNQPPSPEEAISPKGTRHPSMEPAIPTGQEILEQLNQLVGEYAVEVNNSTIGGGREGRTNATGSTPESSSSAEDGAKSPEIVVDDNNVATPNHPVTPPRLATPAPAPTPAPVSALGSAPDFTPGPGPTPGPGSALRSALGSVTGSAPGTAAGSAPDSAPGSAPGSAPAPAPTSSSASASASALAPASASAPAPATASLAFSTAVPTLPAPAPALTTASLPLSTAVPVLAPPPTSTSAVEAPISSRLRARPEKSQKAKANEVIVPQQDQGQPKKRKAPKETVESAKRAKIVAENTTTNSAAARSAGAQLRKNKQKTATKSKAATRVEFPNLIIPNTASSSSSSSATPPQSKTGTVLANNAQEQRATVPGPSKSAGVAKVAAKKAASKSAAGKKRAREDEDEDEDDRHSLLVKKLRMTKAPKAPNPKRVINHAPTRRLDVFVCGKGSSGELGLGNSKTAIDVKCPRLNQNLSARKVGVVHIAVGGMHAAALTHDGLIYTWGVNDQGALGRDTKWEKGANGEMDVDGDDTVDLNPLECTPMPIPREHFPSDTVFTQLACGDSTTFALTDDGEVWGWGTFRNNDGILGFFKNAKIQATPAKLPNLSKVKQIACGANHAMALREDGKVFIWGSGEQNQLGHRVPQRKRYDSLVPTPLRLNKKCRLVGCGIDHSFAVGKEKEDVWTWGPNSFGETGIREGAGGDEAVVFSPVRVPALSLNGDAISAITGGAHHSAATTTSGKLLVWGRLDGHQLGLELNSLPGTDIIKDSSDQPRILTQPTELPAATIGTARLVAVGTDHNVAINAAGQAYSWGFNVNYQCGQGAGLDDIEEPTHIENMAVKNRELIWAGCGGQFSVLAAAAEGDDGPE